MFGQDSVRNPDVAGGRLNPELAGVADRQTGFTRLDFCREVVQTLPEILERVVTLPSSRLSYLEFDSAGSAKDFVGRL